jgi:hypothetical protein
MVDNPTVQMVDFTDGQIVLSMTGIGGDFMDAGITDFDFTDIGRSRARAWMKKSLAKNLRAEMEVTNVRRAESTFGVADVEVIISR